MLCVGIVKLFDPAVKLPAGVVSSVGSLRRLYAVVTVGRPCGAFVASRFMFDARARTVDRTHIPQRIEAEAGHETGLKSVGATPCFPGDMPEETLRAPSSSRPVSNRKYSFRR